MTEDIISQTISMKLWDWAGIELVTPRSAVGLANDCFIGPSRCCLKNFKMADMTNILDIETEKFFL